MDGQDSAGGGTDPRVGGRNRQGYWEVVWSERAGPGAWRTRSVSTRTKDRQEADAFLAAFKLTLERERAEARTGTLAGIVDAYLAARPHIGATQRVHLSTVKKHLGDLTPAGLDDRALASFRTARGVSDGTLRRDLGALVAAMNWARAKKLIAAADVPHVDLPPEGAPRDLWLREAQRDAFWRAVMADSAGKPRLTRVTRFGAIALETAARKAAVEGLTWDRVDLEARLVDFRDPTLRVTKKRRVPVPISDDLLPVLRQAWDERTGPYVLDHGGAIRSAWETFAAGCPFPWVTPHVMRHTWATLAARAGVSVWQIAGVLGDDEDTVRKHYAHHSPDYLRGAVNHRANAAPAAPVPARAATPAARLADQLLGPGE